MVQLKFDPSSITTTSRGVLPPGWYSACIAESGVSPTKKAGGFKLELTFVIDGDRHPDFAGRKIWENLNIVNANAVAVEIAERDLADICNACSIGEMEDTEQLHAIPLAIKLAIEPAKDGYDEKNTIAEYDSETARFKPGAAVAKPKPKAKSKSKTAASADNAPQVATPANDAVQADEDEEAKPSWMK